MPNASRLCRESPTGEPVASVGKAVIRTGLTSWSLHSPTQDWRIYLLKIFYWLNRLEILHITLKI